MMLKKIYFLLLIAFSTGISFAQVNDKIIEDKVSILQQKIYLNVTQVKDINNLFVAQKDELSNEKTKHSALEEIKVKINSVLDQRQKAKYSIIKDSWMKEIEESLK